MSDPKKPVPPATQPDDIPLDIPDAQQVDKELPEGQLPGLPVWRDPLLNPGPTPSEREIPPLDQRVNLTWTARWRASALHTPGTPGAK